jgi:dUTP pyrophosphatase
VKIRIINTSPHPLPEYQSAGAAGLDIRAFLPEPVTLQSLERRLIPTGLFLHIPDGHEAQIRPRSGLSSKRGLAVINAPGTVDADYRGEIFIPIVNLDREPQTIQNGDRIAQMVVARYERIEWELAESLDDSQRGTAGFGSTGS